MMRKIICVVNLMTLAMLCQAQQYAASLIPDSLKENAAAVIRLEEEQVNVRSASKVDYTSKRVVTVLNEEGEKYALLVQGYGKLVSVESIEGTLYDANGNKIKSLKKGDVLDYSADDGSSLIDDSRVKLHRFTFASYPYTVEYNVELRFNTTFFIPSWMPQSSKNTSVEQSRFSIKGSSDISLHYKSYNYNGKPVEIGNVPGNNFTWEARNIKARKDEYASPEWREATTSVYLSSEQFELEGYKGNMSSWQNFGAFIYQLISGRDELPSDLKQKVHALADGETELKKKVAVLYNYLQQNTRYISIQLGIGGWQPFNAAYVAEKKYGDCKALSNFMFSLLKEAGIPAYYTIIKSDNESNFFNEDFPSNQFNHVIVCVPSVKDTIWLECTSQTTPPGFLGMSTCNRPALLITAEGGKLVHTPFYRAEQNLEMRKISATVDNNGNLIAEANTNYHGLQYDFVRGLSTRLSRDKLLEATRSRFDLPQYDVADISYDEHRDRLPSISEKLKITSSNYANVSGKRIFIVPNILTRSRRKPEADDKRLDDVVLDFEYRDVDTAEIRIPPGYIAEALPPDVNVSTKFGTYSSSIKVTDGKIMYYREMKMLSGRFPSSSYNDLVKFHEQVYKSDRSKIVLVKKNE